VSGLLYFIPGETRPLLRGGELDAVGLAGVLRGAAPEFRQSAGPDGAGAGLLIATVGARCEVAAAAQLWQPRLDGRAWTGLWLEARPGPAELLRAEAVGGHEVELHDGNRWQVPAARAFPEGTQLPETLIMGPGGLVRRVTAAYAAIWDDACRVWDSGGELPQAELWRICVRALGVNYRLGPDEANLLELVTSANLPAMAAALVDVPAIAAAATAVAAEESAASKKNGPAGPDTSCGSADSCPATGRPSTSTAGRSEPPAAGAEEGR